MHRSDWEGVLGVVGPVALEYLNSLPTRRVYPDGGHPEVKAALDHPLTDDGVDPVQVVAELARDLAPYITAHASGRFFGFVIGGLHPASWGAELLVSTWDQNAGLFPPTPGVAVAEELAAQWLIDLLHLPPESSVGFVTGGQMANFTCLAAARDEVLRQTGWDVEADGLVGSPGVTVVLKEGVHSTVLRALRFLGLGERSAVLVPCDNQDRVLPQALERTLEAVSGPTIIAVECGNVNTGAFDDFDSVADLADRHRAGGNPTWVHVDGAVMLLAAAAPSMSRHVKGLDRMDSWSTDGHKLLNVAYDCGVAICRNPAAHRAAMSVQASYLEQGTGARDPMDWNPEFSRRARGVGVYATLRSLGRSGVAALVDRTVSHAQRFAQALEVSDRAQVVNDVVSNQALVRWLAPDGDHGRLADRVMAGIRAEGLAFFSGTTYRGERLMRISVSDWATDTDDVDRVAQALLRHAEQGSI
ncbi:pyridoxal phosphate-dependent decarboxylase family protein [Blastococcus saxobsidens]|uniref:Glutamate/tyrosine decarboxylase-like PLP-dependent enzyme n=1 Tax=Blastococcus saxobsidens TaxID=138336 RepID=A0A4V2G252_9ACTN|nr:pyridoxal-dependent decarboxylase [Blastococcus saxobsidens]RZU31756.1 glutamate/tyrosine decarboxylase-like PLP-dependent enzyme [Blastococcus saxobsidens]